METGRVPSGTVVLRGAGNESWIVVAAYLRSVRRAIAALHHPKQAHGAIYPRGRHGASAPSSEAAPSTVRPLARDPWVLIGWPFLLGFDLDGRLLLARRGRVCVQFIFTIITTIIITQMQRE